MINVYRVGLTINRICSVQSALYVLIVVMGGISRPVAANDNLPAHRLFQAGEYTPAGEIFNDAAWTGVALYRSENGGERQRHLYARMIHSPLLTSATVRSNWVTTNSHLMLINEHYQ